MKKNYLIILIYLLLNNCALNNVVNHHGVHFLEKKQVKIKTNIFNKNDIVKVLGQASIIDNFNNNIWIYLERKTSVSGIKSFGKEKLLKNDVLVLEFNNRGLLVKKNFYNKNDLNKIEITKNQTETSNKEALLKNILSTLRRKINDPLGKRIAK